MGRFKSFLLFQAVLLAVIGGAGPNQVLSQNPLPQDNPAPRTFPELDRFGDPLPAGALFRLGTERFRHRYVGRLVYSPDGKVLASITVARLADVPEWQFAILWDAASGKKLHLLEEVHDLVFSADSQAVAVVTPGTAVRVIDVKTGREKFRIPVMPQPLRPRQMEESAIFRPLHPFAFSPDGVLATTGEEGRIHLWDASNGKPLTRFVSGAKYLLALGLCADGKEVISVDEEFTLRRHQRKTGKELHKIALGRPDKRFGRDFSDPAPFISADGRFYCDAGYRYLRSVGRKNTLRIWDIASGKEVARLPGVMRPLARSESKEQSEGAITSVALSPDGKTLAFAEHSNIITLVDVATGKTRDLKRRDGVADFGLAFAPDGKTLAAACTHGHTIRLWDVASGKEKTDPAVHTGDVYSLALSRDGRFIATGGRDHTIKLWDRANVKHLQTFRGPESDVNGLCFAPDSKYLASICHNGLIQVFDLVANEEARDLRKTVGFAPPHAVSYSPGGDTIAALVPAVVKKADPFRREFYPKGEFRVWEAASGKDKFNRPLEFSVSFSYGAAASPDGAWLAWGTTIRGLPGTKTDKLLYLFQPMTGKYWKIDGPHIDVNRLAFSHDGHILAVGGDKEVHLYNTQTRRFLRTIQEPGAGMGDFAFSPDGRYLAGTYMNQRARTTTIRLWELASERPVLDFVNPLHWEGALAFAADSKTLFSAGGLTTAYAWGLEPASWRKGPPARFDRATLAAAWKSLADSDAALGYEAVWQLAGAGNRAVTFVKQHLTPATPLPEKTLTRLLNELDYKEFKVRTAAMAELRDLGPRAEVGLRQALAKPSSLEAGRRIQSILTELEEPMRSPESLRQVRAVEALERIGTAEARQLLRDLAGGLPQARLTREAGQALKRLR